MIKVSDIPLFMPINVKKELNMLCLLKLELRSLSVYKKKAGAEEELCDNSLVTPVQTPFLQVIPPYPILEPCCASQRNAPLYLFVQCLLYSKRSWTIKDVITKNSQLYK